VALNNLAEYYMERDRFSEARLVYGRLVPLMEQVFGLEHPETATAVANFCTATAESSPHLDGKLLCQRALRLREKILGANHPDVAYSLSSLGTTYAREGDFKQAELLLRRAVMMMDLFPDAEHIAIPLNNLGDLFAKQKKFGLAADAFAQSIAKTEQRLGNEHPALIRILVNLGYTYLLDKNAGGAEPVFRRALNIVERSRGTGHIDGAVPLLLGLAKIAAGRGQRPEAEALLVRAETLMESIAPSGQLAEEVARIAREVSRTKRK
jgi:tetratricopeptide (TPR) repeat protein